MAKAGLWADTDAEERKRGERTGLDTLVVHAVNVSCGTDNVECCPHLVPTGYGVDYQGI